MNMRNLLRPGDFVMLMPVGIHITLQYDISGGLEKIYTGFDADRVDRTKELLHSFLAHDMVPSKIPLTKGTSWVRGVLYAGIYRDAHGPLPKAVEEGLLKKLSRSPETFHFFAATMECTSLVFHGSAAVRQSLAMAKFRLLPGWVIPVGVNDDVVSGWVHSNLYPFAAVVTDLVVYHNEEATIVSTGLSQREVEQAKVYQDIHGYLKVEVTFKGSDTPMYLDYSDAAHYTVKPGTTLVVDNHQRIVYSRPEDGAKPYDTALTCRRCGKRYTVPSSGEVLCPDEHCPSRLMPHITQFLHTLNLPVYDEQRLWKEVKKDRITCIPDLFLLPEYMEIHVEISFSTLLRAMVPISLIPQEDVFTAFSFACAQEERAYRYYIQNPEQIASDLGLQHRDLDKLVGWLSDGYHASDITTLLNLPNIQITAPGRKFDGAPIFRNKTICITGEFIHGSLAEIATILQSYAAKVVFQFANTVDCVVTGGTNENLDGRIIRDARSLGKPVISESDFFMEYGIDEDLRTSLRTIA